MNSQVSIVIAQAKPAEFSLVRALIVQGLAERWKPYEPTFNPDLEDFTTFYGDSVVLVARIEDQIVACGVVMKERDGVGRIVRMSVSKEHRRLGLGSRLLAALLQAGNELGYRQFVLETTATWESAVAFYQSHGFSRTKLENGDQHFILAQNAA